MVELFKKYISCNNRVNNKVYSSTKRELQQELFRYERILKRAIFNLKIEKIDIDKLISGFESIQPNVADALQEMEKLSIAIDNLLDKSYEREITLINPKVSLVQHTYNEEVSIAVVGNIPDEELGDMYRVLSYKMNTTTHMTNVLFNILYTHYEINDGIWCKQIGEISCIFDKYTTPEIIE